MTALVLVATVNRADALATVALALAVLAFVAEIVLAISQTVASNQQFAQTSSINAQTLETLAEIRFATGETLARRDQQFDRLLESVVPAALAQSLVDQPELSPGFDIDALGDQLAETVVRQLDRASKLSVSDATDVSVRSQLDVFMAEHPRVSEFLRTLPASSQLRVWRHIASHFERLARYSEQELLDELREYHGLDPRDES